MIFKIFILIFIIFAASRTYLRFKDKSINIASLSLWILIWLTVLLLVFDPKISDIAASLLGINGGVNAMFFIAIILLFYLVFRLYVKMDTIDKHLTDLSIETSKELHKKNKL